MHGGDIEVFYVIVKFENLAAVRVYLIVVFLVAAVKLNVVDGTPIVIIELSLGEYYLLGGKLRMVECGLFCFVRCY